MNTHRIDVVNILSAGTADLYQKLMEINGNPVHLRTDVKELAGGEWSTDCVTLVEQTGDHSYTHHLCLHDPSFNYFDDGSMEIMGFLPRWFGGFPGQTPKLICYELVKVSLNIILDIKGDPDSACTEQDEDRANNRIDRNCENCGRDLNDQTECPFCGKTTVKL